MKIIIIIALIILANNSLANDTLKKYFSGWRENKIKRVKYLNFFLDPENQNTVFFKNYLEVADILGVPNSEKKKDYTYIILDDKGHKIAEILFTKKRKSVVWMVRYIDCG